MPIIHLKSKENGELLSKGSKEQINFIYFSKLYSFIDLTSSNMVWVLQILRGKKKKKKKIIPNLELRSLMFKKFLYTESGIVGKAMVLNAEIAKPFKELFESNRDRML